MPDPTLDADALARAGLLLPTGVRGLYHRSFAFEHLVRGIEALVAASASQPPRGRVQLSSLQPASTLEASGYVASFPNLVGAVATLAEPQAAAVARDPSEWAARLEPSGVTLCSAACQGLYPLVANERFEEAGSCFEVQCWCFRHEPSDDPVRMQWFRQHEFVCIGGAAAAVAHRDEWLERALGMFGRLGIAATAEVANDPFFGRTAAMMRESQRDKALKFEVVAACTTAEPRAISSANYHETHFGEAFSLQLVDGSVAHTACIGFGLERIALALVRRHGTDLRRWPDEVAELVIGPAAPEAWGDQ